MPKINKNSNLYIYLCILLLAFIGMILYNSIQQITVQHVEPVQIEVPATHSTIVGISTRNLPEVAIDIYGPPLRNDQPPIPVIHCNGYPRNSTDVRGPIIIEHGLKEELCNIVPINIETRGIPREFTQVGILQSDKKSQDSILSLFGRQIMTSGDKWQYYTLSNVGIMPTRLNVRVIQNGTKAKDAMCEYGIDRIYSGDIVIVDGYNEEYKVQIYESRQYRYIG